MTPALLLFFIPNSHSIPSHRGHGSFCSLSLCSKSAQNRGNKLSRSSCRIGKDPQVNSLYLPLVSRMQDDEVGPYTVHGARHLSKNDRELSCRRDECPQRLSLPMIRGRGVGVDVTIIIVPTLFRRLKTKSLVSRGPALG